MAVRAYLDLPDGMAVRVGAAGLLVGRHRSCDVQLADETSSRRHALLRVAPEGVELVVLGRQPVLVDDRPCSAAQLLRGDERLGFPGLACRLRVEQAPDSLRVTHVLRRGRERVRVHVSPFVIGPGAAAHVAIAGWAGGDEVGLRFRTAQGVLYVEVVSGSAAVGAEALAADTPHALAVGDEITYLGETFVVEQAEDGDASTVVGAASTLVSALVLHPLPRGGRVALAYPDGERIVYLPGRRFALLSALAAPPAPLTAGDYVPDAELIACVWDADEVVGRQDVNVLLTRCRQDLVAAGISATSLVERAPGGRATRLRLAPGASVTTATDS